MSARDDRDFLETIALGNDLAGDDETAGRIRDIAKRIVNPDIEVVEQGTLMPKSPSVPDGLSWTDLVFTGNFWGIRPTKGEPFIEQRGHLIVLRQAETSFSERQVPIYELASSLRSPEGGTVTVAVVFGFMGERSGLVWFREGAQGPLITLDGARDLQDEIETQLRWCVANPAGGDYRTTIRKPPSKQTSLDDL